MVCYSLAIEDAETLVAEPATANTINVQNSRMRGQAGPDSRMSVALGPVHQCGQAPPVWLVHEVRRPRLCPRYNEAVEMAVPEIIDVGIEAADTALAQICSRDVRQRIEPQAQQDVITCRIEQCVKLPFGRFQCRTGHVVDEADIEAVRCRLMELDRRFPAPAVRPGRRVMHRRMSIQTDRHR